MAMASQVRLQLLPSARCLYDEPVGVQVDGLGCRQLVTLRARATDEKGVVFSSAAHYRADASGKIHLDRDPSLGGSYLGVEPMGLLWAMKADTVHTYFHKNNSLDPQTVRFSVEEEEEEGGRALAQATNERLLMGDGVSRLTVNQGNIQGVLFTPPGEGPFPPVLDVYTFKSEKRACLLANRGFMVLSVAVYNSPANVKELHLDHFEEAVDFLKLHPKAGSKGIGILATSKGGDIALSLAAFVPGVEAVVCINGCCANVAVPLYYRKQKILSALMYDTSKVIPTESGAGIVKYTVNDHLAEENRSSLVPIEKAQGRFLLVAAEDDLNWDSKAYMDSMVERLKRHGRENFEEMCYPGAGHYLEPPYGPHRSSDFNRFAGMPVLWGGEPRSHAAAEVHLWKKIQEFLRAQLSCDAKPTEAKL